jgi:hypothetical protein
MAVVRDAAVLEVVRDLTVHEVATALKSEPLTSVAVECKNPRIFPLDTFL